MKNHMNSKSAEFNNSFITFGNWTAFSFYIKFQRQDGNADTGTLFIFIIKPIQADWSPYSNSHKRQKKKCFIRLIYNISFEKKLYGSRKHNYESMKHSQHRWQKFCDCIQRLRDSYRLSCYFLWFGCGQLNYDISLFYLVNTFFLSKGLYHSQNKKSAIIFLSRVMGLSSKPTGTTYLM